MDCQVSALNRLVKKETREDHTGLVLCLLVHKVVRMNVSLGHLDIGVGVIT